MLGGTSAENISNTADADIAPLPDPPTTHSEVKVMKNISLNLQNHDER
jgi:hypothetical protein